jgi:ABC-type sugar transport system substrate-binding protein
MKDLIISASTRYTKKELHNYVESINQSGFDGDKIMVVYDITKETVDWLKENGWEVYQSQLQGHIHMYRLITIQISYNNRC